MTPIKPLKCCLGQPAEGEDRFYIRASIISKIHRALDNGENILISAPRRIGKSSVLKHIKNNPQKNQIIKYLIVQSIDSHGDFFKRLYGELITDNEIFDGVNGYAKRASKSVTHAISKLRGISWEGGIQIDGDDNVDYYRECCELFSDFQHKKVVIFIDEFPDALNNMLKKDPQQGIHFLQQNRDIRQQYSGNNLQFVYTGSTGLRQIVGKLGKPDLINDITEITIPPFTETEAKELIHQLVAGFQHYQPGFKLSNTCIEHIIHTLNWCLPYFLQIIINSLFEHYEDSSQLITPETINTVLDEMVQAKSRQFGYFENWQERLKHNFNAKEHAFATAVLNHAAKYHSIDTSHIDALAHQHLIEKPQHIINSLDYDGYISADQQSYGFNSFLLKRWWINNVAR